MADQHPVKNVAEALCLLDTPQFQTACDQVHSAYSLGQFSHPRDTFGFFDTWGVAPTRNDGLYRPTFRDEAGAILAGRWGLVLILPWTTEADTRAQVRKIHRAIGKRHRDSLERAYRDAVAAWLRRSGFAHSEIAATLYGRRQDATRPTVRQIKRSAALRRVDKLVAQYRKEGIPYRLAERRAYMVTRGTEGRGALAARAAARRAENDHRLLKADIQAPRAATPLTAAVTELIHARFIAPDPTRTDAALNRLRAVLLGQPDPAQDTPPKTA